MPRRKHPITSATPLGVELPTPPALASANGSAAARCKQTLSGWRPYWQHGKDNECGKKAHWLWKSSLRGELSLCTRHAKAVGLDKCKPLKPQNAEVCDGGRKASELKQDANRHSQH